MHSAATAPVVVQAEPLLVRADAAAELLGLGVRTFHRHVANGRIPGPVRIGRRRLWRLDDLRRFVEAGCRQPTNE